MKPIRLIELFAGYGSQAMALEQLGYTFEHHFVCEFDKYAIKAYNAAHGTDFDPSDICNIHAVDLNIVDKAQFTYLLSYLLIPMHGFIRNWKTGGNGTRIQHTFRVIVGSKTHIGGMWPRFA